MSGWEPGSVETFHGTPDGQFRVTLVDGKIQRLVPPLTALDPSGGAALGRTLTDLLNAALDKHGQDLLAAASERTGPTSDESMVAGHAASQVAQALEVIAGAPSHQREYESALEGAGPTVRGTSADGDVVVAATAGRLTGIEFSHSILSSARIEPLASAVVEAVHAALETDDQRLGQLAGLTAAQVDAELADVRSRIDDLGARNAE